jgi:SAM-dependent methyltransferase
VDADAAEASEVVLSWLASAKVVALLRAACDADLLQLLAVPATPRELAQRIGCDPARVGLLCQALQAHGVLDLVGDGYRTSPAFVALEGAGQPLLLRELVAADVVLQRGIETVLADPAEPVEVGEDESLAFARLAWGRPGSRAAQDLWRTVDEQMPEVVQMWERGGTHAEFGCGVGRDLLRIAVMYPQVHVIGYDLAEHLLDDCRAQADTLGVDDRVSLVAADVLGIEVQDAYDTLMWSQMFFPSAVRGAVLDAIVRALVPGGLLLMPLMPAVPAPDQTDRSPATRGVLLTRLAYYRWDIQWDSPEEVRREIEDAGFTYLRTIHNPRTPYVLAQLG